MASPISTQQRSAPESLEQFHRRMRNVVSRLNSADPISFCKRVNKSMATKLVHGPFAYSLELPIRFLIYHSKKFGIDVTFVMKDSERKWPVKLTVRSFRRSRARVFAYGAGGWKAFLQDNSIKVGDFLIFNLVRFSLFEVVIERAPVDDVQPDEDSQVHPKDDGNDNGEEVLVDRAPVRVHPEETGNGDEGEVDMDIENEDKDADSKWYRNPSPWWNAEQAPVGCKSCNKAPRFSVDISPSSRPRRLNLAVPGHFWDLHRSMLKGNDLLLKGPNKAIFAVKAKKTYNAKEGQLRVRLESGWEAFVVANKLRVEDILAFYLVGNSCFTVDRLKY